MNSKFHALLGSRKFWALITSLVAVAGAFYTSQISGQDAANSIVIALAVY